MNEEEIDATDGFVAVKDEAASLEEFDINGSQMQKLVHETLEVVELPYDTHNDRPEKIESIDKVCV